MQDGAISKAVGSKWDCKTGTFLICSMPRKLSTPSLDLNLAGGWTGGGLFPH